MSASSHDLLTSGEWLAGATRSLLGLRICTPLSFVEKRNSLLVLSYA